MPNAVLADAILIFHALFTSVVIFSVPLILIGGLLGWSWVRNRWFRIIHLCMIGFVVLEVFIGMACPLTVWENALRVGDGQSYDGQDFIARWVGKMLYYPLPHWVFSVLYVGFGLLVVSLFFLVPIRKKCCDPQHIPYC